MHTIIMFELFNYASFDVVFVFMYIWTKIQLPTISDLEFNHLE